MQTKRLIVSCTIFATSTFKSFAFTAPIAAKDIVTTSVHPTSVQISSNRCFSTNLNSSNLNIATNMSEEEKTSSPKVRVVSYNILSSELADPEFFTKCKPENLKAANRLPKILDKLEEEIKMHKSGDECTPVVFCLQEVSHEWATSLHVFFAEKGYHMVTGLYGKRFNGYMGIATAYPTKYFETVKVDLVRLSEKKQGGWPRKPKAPEPSKLRKFIFDPIYNPMKAAYRYYRPKKRVDDAWDVSQWRFNQFIAVKLKHRIVDEKGNNKSTPFWLGNYHMPCAFRTPAVMNIHADLVGCRIQKLAKEEDENIPFILAGDFNILPDSPHYQLLRTGELDEKDETYPDEKHSVMWKPNLKGMRSAYVDMTGEEPEYTNAAHNGALNNDSFIGTLDYIFLSDEWKVKEILETPKRESLEGVYPDDEQPSDHLMIAATLEM